MSVSNDSTISFERLPIQKIAIDDFRVTNEMSKANSANRKEGSLYSYSKAWFRDSSNQVLIFELYTDYHRLKTILFSHWMTEELINEVELNTANGDLATYQQKFQYFHFFIAKAKAIPQDYFTSNKEFKLGDNNKELAIKTYGKPDSVAAEKNYEIYFWTLNGDIAPTQANVKSNKPLAENSFGHKITMYYKDEKLIGLILYNSIP